MKNQEYIAFVDEVGRSVDGKFVYQLDFTYDPESVWGDFFNIIPAVIVPDLKPDINSLSSTAHITTDTPLSLAKTNGCFSMQDCIDGIISLCFFETEEGQEGKNKFHLAFGETFESVKEKLKTIEVEMTDHKLLEKNEEEIDTLISNLNRGLKSDYIFMELSVGESYEREDIRDELYENGYKLVDLVENEGEYAIRGYMIDIFSFSAEYPYRVNFFGDEIEDIFSFDFVEGKEVEHYKKIELYTEEVNG